VDEAAGGFVKSVNGGIQDSYRRFYQMDGRKSSKSIEAFTSEDARVFRQWLLDGAGRKKPSSKKTAANKIKTITAVFSQAMAEGLINTNPLASLKALPSDNKLTRQPFTMDEVNRLILNSPDNEWRGLITVAAFTGLRLGDCMGLVWDDVNLGAGYVETVPAKTKRSNRVVKIPITPTLRAYLEAIPEDDRCGHVLKSLSQVSQTGRTGVSLQFVELMEKAGVGRGKSQNNGSKTFYERGFHSLRHTLTSWMANANVPEEIRMKILGHSTQSVHALYTHLGDETLALAMAGIPQLSTIKKQ